MTQVLTGKRLLVLDGTRIGCEIVRHAQALGIHTVVADYNDLTHAPAKQMADEHVLVSITDVDAVVDVIRRRQIDGVVAGFSDKMLPYYAEICRRSGLPCYGTPELFHLFTDKRRYKAKFREFAVPTIEEYERSLFYEDDVCVRYPVIVKPSGGSGSQGIVVCRDAVETRAALDQIRARSEDAVVERYMSCEEATVFWVFQDGEYFISSVANRHVVRTSEEGPPLPFAYTMPSRLIPDYERDVAPKVRAMLKSVGVRDGMMFMQGVVDEGVFRTYDLGFRLTGSLEYRLIDRLSGYNPLTMLINLALGGTMGVADLAQRANPSHHSYGYNVSVSMNAGQIGSISGVPEVEGLPGVLAVIPTRDAGDSLAPEAIGQLRQITVRVLGTAKSASELRDRIAYIASVVRIIGDGGDDLTVAYPQVPDVVEVVL